MLIEIAHDYSRLQKWADQSITDAMAEARRAEIEIRDRAAAAFEQVLRDHSNRTL
jgi:hypothetical protein